MRSTIRRLFWCEVCFSVAALVTLAVTLVWPSWIELALGVDPDRGSGAAELAIAIASAAIAVASGALARYARGLRAQHPLAATHSWVADEA